MKTLSMLKVAFDTHISAREIPAFRSALMRQIGDVDSAGAASRHYPLLQCKTRRSYDKQQPMIVCLGSAPKLFLRFSQQGQWQAKLNGRAVDMQVAYSKFTDFRMACHPNLSAYHIYNYLPLNQEDYPAYKALHSLADKGQFLSQCLKKHILQFAKGVDWLVDGEVKVEVTHIRVEVPVPYKGLKLHRFDLDFKSNVFLPEYIGLAKGASSGYGVVRRDRKGKEV
jgi:hypothetical protein